jgi:1,3-beta-glucan synthase
MKQSRLRKRRVWRYAAVYFAMLVIFLALLVGPVLSSKNITGITNGTLGDLLGPNAKEPLTNILQPVGQNNNDTFSTAHTGTGAPNYPNNTGTAAVSIGAVESSTPTLV